MIGFGTYKLNKEEAYKMTLEAIKIGYRFFDTAEIYNNEKYVKQAIDDSKIDRSELFLTCKLSTKNEDKIEKSFKKRIKIFEKIDLVLLHWVSNDSIKGWTILNELYNKNRDKVKHIGISNISKDTLLKIIETGNKPYAIQNEFNPYCTDFEVIDICKKEGIKYIAHSCFAYGELFLDNDIKFIAENNTIYHY
jgi:diketogulonate reductase-like aldo/keto reductase